MGISIKLPSGSCPTFLVLSRPGYRRRKVPLDLWALHRDRHVDVLRYLQDCKVKGDAKATVDGKRIEGGWATARELRRITGIAHDDSRIVDVLYDIAEHLEAIEIEPHDGPGPTYIIWLLTVPEPTADAWLAPFREPFYDVDKHLRGELDALLRVWQALYLQQVRSAYRSRDLRREKAALYGYLRAVGDPERVGQLIRAFLQGYVHLDGNVIPLNLTRYPRYKRHGATIMTFVAIAIGFARQVDQAVHDLCEGLKVGPPAWAYPTEGEKRLEVSRVQRGYASRKGYRYGQPLLKDQRMPMKGVRGLEKRLGLPAPGQSYLDDDERWVYNLGSEREARGVKAQDMEAALGITTEMLLQKERKASKTFAKRYRKKLAELVMA